MRHMLAAAALACAASLIGTAPAWATLVYEVDVPTLTGGGYTIDVSGTVTTDGTLGELDGSNIVAFELNFAGTGGFNLTLSDATPVLDGVDVFGYLLQATATELTIGSYIQFSDYADPGMDYIDFMFSGSQFMLDYSVDFDGFTAYANGDETETPGTYAFAAIAETSPVPLPGALALLGAGLSALGLAARRRAG